MDYYRRVFNGYNKDMAKVISDKQRKFADLIIEGKTQAEAYVEAYGKTNNIASNASNVYRSTLVQNYIKEVKGEAAKQVSDDAVISAKEIIERYVTMADATLWDVLYVDRDKKGNTRLRLKEDADLSNVQEVKLNQYGQITGIRLYDRKAILDKLADIFNVAGEFVDNSIELVISDDLKEYAE